MMDLIGSNFASRMVHHSQRSKPSEGFKWKQKRLLIHKQATINVSKTEIEKVFLLYN